MRKLRIRDDLCNALTEAASFPGVEPCPSKSSLLLLYYLFILPSIHLFILYFLPETPSFLSIIHISSQRGSIGWEFKIFVLQPNVFRFQYKLFGVTQESFLMSVCLLFYLYIWNIISPII